MVGHSSIVYHMTEYLSRPQTILIWNSSKIRGILVGMENREAFGAWLNEQLRDRGWSQRELARRSDMSHSTISDVLGNVRRPSWDFCASIAGALDLDPDSVFVLAGLKARPPAPVGEETEALAILRTLDLSLRSAAVAMLRGLAGHRDRLAGVSEGAVAYLVQDDLERELLEAFRQLSPRWQEVFLEDAQRAAEMGMVRMIGEEAGEDGETEGT